MARRIRDEKILTQLYVSKVVGVTTDTISRWENNRYPTIKRENALRLAEALEVPVEEVLQRDGEADAEPLAPAPAARHPLRFLPLLLVPLVLVGVYFFSFRTPPPPVNLEATRELPNFAAPGTIIPVRVHLEIGSAPKGFILREHFPPGWKLIEAVPPASSLDNESGMARWILKPDEGLRRVSYLIRVDPRAEVGKNGTFSGELIANPDGGSAPATVDGTRQIQVAAFLWADQNGDRVVDDAEMLQASDTLDQMRGVHLDWAALEEIWDAGSYVWEPKKERFLPVRNGELSTPAAK
jgi:transcriptional regulator with XRE-family HTH domain